jgi:hypothetical protein
MKNKIVYIFICVAAFALSACSSSQESFSFEIKGKEFVLDQPTPGSNTAQFEIGFEEIAAAANAKGLDASKISAVKLEKVELLSKEGQNLNTFESALLQLTTSKANLTEVALLNPIPAGTTNAKLNVAENAEMQKYFTGDKLTVVLDMNAPEGDTLKHSLLLNATFQMSAPKK